jgi:DNA-binding CsgD family transcriptional regulator
MNLDKIRDALKRLSPREREVMNHVVSGLLNKEVAAELGITERTVKQDRARVMAKMGVKTFAELITVVLTIQFNGRHEEANMQSMLSLKNADALKIMADVLQTSPESFLEHLVFWHCQAT